jgi:SAM-dependent methyltransferase
MIEDTAESTSDRFTRQISSGDVVLDLGTKRGEKLADTPGTVVAVDIRREPMVRSDATVEFALADGMELPFRADSFDYVFCSQVLEHVSGTGPIVAEAARVLKPDGLAYFGFPNRLSLRKPHNIMPRYCSLLPRHVGLLILPYLLDAEAYDYYQHSLFPLSPIGARWHFHRHFDVVQYPMRMDPRPKTASVRLQAWLWWANTVAKLPPLKWLGELLWPASNYVLADPKSSPKRQRSHEH